WENEIGTLRAVKQIQEQIDAKQVELEQAQRQGNWEVAARIQCGEMRDLKRQLEESEKKIQEMSHDGNAMVKEEVTTDKITEVVRRRPYSVILFDDVEKAHRDVFNVLLQVLDDGRLTDGQGRTVDFKNTVIVMTSNIGSAQIQELKSKGAEEWEVEAAVKDLLKNQFRPEFLNRIDETI